MGIILEALGLATNADSENSKGSKGPKGPGGSMGAKDTKNSENHDDPEASNNTKINLGGLVYSGPNVYSGRCKHLLEEYGDELEKKEAKLVLKHVQVQDEHVYPLLPPQYNTRTIGSKYANLDYDEEKKRTTKYDGIVCTCGDRKAYNGPSMGEKGVKVKTVVVGAKKRKKCKNCENCKREKCLKCMFCLQPHLKKPCKLKVCLFPIVPNCPCFT